MKALKGRNIYNQFHIIQHQAPVERNIYSNLLERESKAPAKRHFGFMLTNKYVTPLGFLIMHY